MQDLRQRQGDLAHAGRVPHPRLRRGRAGGGQRREPGDARERDGEHQQRDAGQHRVAEHGLRQDHGNGRQRGRQRHRVGHRGGLHGDPDGGHDERHGHAGEQHGRLPPQDAAPGRVVETAQGGGCHHGADHRGAERGQDGGEMEAAREGDRGLDGHATALGAGRLTVRQISAGPVSACLVTVCRVTACPVTACRVTA